MICATIENGFCNFQNLFSQKSKITSCTYFYLWHTCELLFRSFLSAGKVVRTMLQVTILAKSYLSYLLYLLKWEKKLNFLQTMLRQCSENVLTMFRQCCDHVISRPTKLSRRGHLSGVGDWTGLARRPDRLGSATGLAQDSDRTGSG